MVAFQRVLLPELCTIANEDLVQTSKGSMKSTSGHNIPKYISNHGNVVDYYGWWPTLHDREVQELQLNQEGPSCWARLYFYDMNRNPETLDCVEADRYSKILIEFNQIQDVELHDFNEQNVLSCMVFEKVNGDLIRVTLPSIYGLGGSFKCKSVECCRA